MPTSLPDRLTGIDETNRSQQAHLEESDRCRFFGEYFSGKGYQGGGTNQLIFNFKIEPSIALANAARRSYKEQAIDIIAAGLRRVVGADNAKRLTFVPIPPSKTRDHPEYDDRLTRALAKAFQGFDADIRDVLRRRSSTEADHLASARLSRDALYELLEVDTKALNAKPVRRTVVVFDDVVTSGKSFKCCQQRLVESLPRIHRSSDCSWRDVSCEILRMSSNRLATRFAGHKGQCSWRQLNSSTRQTVASIARYAAWMRTTAP